MMWIVCGQRSTITEHVLYIHINYVIRVKRAHKTQWSRFSWHILVNKVFVFLMKRNKFWGCLENESCYFCVILCVCVCVCFCMCLCVCLCLSISVSASVYVCLSVCVCMCLCVCIWQVSPVHLCSLLQWSLLQSIVGKLPQNWVQIHGPSACCTIHFSMF